MDKSLTPGWEPDTAVVDQVLSGKRGLRDLETCDRAVVVAELTMRGESVELIADRLGCSTRVVKRMRAFPLTRTLMRARDAESRVEQWQSRAVSQSGGDVDRLQTQVQVLSSALDEARRELVGRQRRQDRQKREALGQFRLF